MITIAEIIPSDGRLLRAENHRPRNDINQKVIISYMVSSFFVFTRIISNPLSNVFQKKLTGNSASPFFIILITHLLLSLAMLPILFQILPAQLRLSFYINIILCVLLAIAGNTLIVAALRLTDLSVLGPINAYKSIVSLVLGIFLLGEIPTVMGAAGILLILVGSYFFIDQGSEQNEKNVFIQFFKDKGVQLRLAALILSATEAVFLKKALLLSSPLITFVFWCILGAAASMIFSLFALKTGILSQLDTVKQRTSIYLLLALTTGLMQFSTLYTFGVLQVGYSLALFQTSALLSIFFGYKFFQEQNILQRLLGASIMVIGAIFIVVFGKS
jgi:drug/metabolite transporter (DMT)-like permease